MEESWRLCSFALRRRYSMLVVVRSSSGGRILSGVGGVVGAKDRLLSRIAAAVTAAAAAAETAVTGGVGTGKGVRTGTRVVVRDESWGVRVVRAGSRLVKERRLGVDWRSELGKRTKPAFWSCSSC